MASPPIDHDAAATPSAPPADTVDGTFSSPFGSVPLPPGVDIAPVSSFTGTNELTSPYNAPPTHQPPYDPDDVEQPAYDPSEPEQLPYDPSEAYDPANAFQQPADPHPFQHQTPHDPFAATEPFSSREQTNQTSDSFYPHKPDTGFPASDAKHANSDTTLNTMNGTHTQQQAYGNTSGTNTQSAHTQTAGTASMEEPLKTTASTTDTTNLDDRHPYWFVLLGIAVAFVINALAFLFLRCIDFFSLHGRRKRAYTVGCVIGTVLSVIFWIVIYLVVIRRAIYWVGPTVEEVPINEVTRSPVSALQMF